MKSIANICLVLSLIVGIAGCSDSGQAPEKKVAATASAPDNFAQVTTKLDSPAFGSVDGISGIPTPHAGSVVSVKGDKIEVAGFAVDAAKGEAAAGVVVLIDGKQYIAIFGGERPDIAKALNNLKYVKSQFYVAIPVKEVGVGSHQIGFRVIASDKSGYYESKWTAKLDITQ